MSVTGDLSMCMQVLNNCLIKVQDWAFVVSLYLCVWQLLVKSGYQ